MAVKSLNESTEIRELSAVLALAPAGNSLDDIFVAPTVAADGVDFNFTGREVVTVKNSHGATPYTFTIKSVADAELLNRTGDIGPYSLAAGESATFILNKRGFKSPQGKALIVMENVAVVVAVNRLPGLTS